MHTDVSEARPVDGTHSALLELSNAMVRLYKVQFGRGPTKAQSVFAGPDIVICSLEDTLTPAERNLVAMGEQQRMRDTRLLVQSSAENEFRETVERITGRKVRGFVSGMDVGRDIASEVFYLEPNGSGG